METVLQLAFNGLTQSSIYALVALGLVLVFGIMEIADFAQGSLYTVGAYVGYGLVAGLGLPYLLGLVGAGAVVAALAGANYYVAYRPLERHLGTNTMIVALGVLVVLENLVLLVAGSSYRYLSSPFGSGGLTLGGVVLGYHKLFILGVTALLVAAVWLLLRRTRVGRAVQALSQNRFSARLCGVDVARASAVTFLVAGCLAGVAGALTAPLFPLSPTMGSLLIVKAFAIVIFAGLGSILGVLVGSLVIGLAETVAIAYWAGQYADVLAFALVIVILLRRPGGLFGEASR